MASNPDQVAPDASPDHATRRLTDPTPPLPLSAMSVAGASPARSAPLARSLVRFLTSFRAWHYALLLGIHAAFFDAKKIGINDWYLVFYPWADAVRITLTKYHEFPWWNPWTISGQPLFADPQAALLMPETLLTLAFGTVLGLKLAIVFYVLVGYEGTRLLCREIFGRRRVVEALAIIPILLPTLALHFNEGHIVFFDFYLFPWLLGLALTWQRSAERSLAFGVVIGLFLLSYIHYTIIMSFTIVAVVVLARMLPRARSLDTWQKAALVVCTALGIGLTRVVLALSIVKGFPRAVAHYPIAYPLSAVLATLVEPFQNRTTNIHVSDLSAWEMSSYVGLCALLLAYEGFRRRDRRYWPLYLGAVLCLVLAWNNRDWMFPSHWLRLIPPWQSMLVTTRWAIFACYFILLGTVHGLLGIHDRGNRARAIALALFVVADLAFHVGYGYRGMFTDAVAEPPLKLAEGPAKTVGEHQENTWPNIRRNIVTGGAECSLLGMKAHMPARMKVGDRGYRGEFYGSKPVQVESWTPNRIVLAGTPGDTVTLNVNPSNYWSMNGERLFPEDRAFEIHKPFTVKVPPGGRMELLPRPPHLPALLGLQALFAGAAGLLAWQLKRRPARGEKSPGRLDLPAESSSTARAT